MAITPSRRPVDLPEGVGLPAGRPEWGSDLIVEVLAALGIEYAALLPGSTFRGIHDSIVNYAGNRRPELILVNHEMISVSIARGYARATGKPMAAITHDFVGLLNASMTIYDAWASREPVLILGGTGPVDAARRRPWIDWIHTAHVQGNAVRDFTKWDDQPASIEAIPESLFRAYRMAVSEPAGPVYVCFDVDIQEERVDGDPPATDPTRFRPAAGIQPDDGGLREAAEWLVGADLPLIMADRLARHPEAAATLLELAELLQAPVIDFGSRQNIPTPHPLDFAGEERALLADADVVLALDMTDLHGAMRGFVDQITRVAESAPRAGQRVINISVDEFAHRGLTTEYQALPAVDLPLLGDTRLALPGLLETCRALLGGPARARIERRRQILETQQSRLRARQRDYFESQWDHPQITEARMIGELGGAIEGEDFVLTYSRYRRQAPGVLHISGPGQSLGYGVGGGAIGAAPGVVVGAALALRDSGKIPVAVIGDGEFLSSIQALWTAAHYRIPGLLVVNNNRSYYNDEEHQHRIASFRGRPPENRWIGQRIEDPQVDFGAIARTFGLFGEGPVTAAADLGPALRRGIAAVKEGRFAVVDVWTENRAAS